MVVPPPIVKPDPSATGVSPIKDTPFRRFLTKLALKTTARLYRSNGVCFQITPHKILKTGPYVDLTEAASMRFIKERTSLPVPKVHCAFISKGRAHIVMEKLPGVNILYWLRTMSDEAGGDALLAQLKGYLDGMRALPPPGIGVESCVGGSLYDSRIMKRVPRFGPFKTIQDFHFYLRDGLKLATMEDEDTRTAINKMIARHGGEFPPPVFTHGDFNPSNILVHKGQISGIIDWEFAGWYPHYWEYTSAVCGNRLRTIWSSYFDRFLTPYPEDLEMEITRQTWWGDFF